jgi:hypothetical protein
MQVLQAMHQLLLVQDSRMSGAMQMPHRHEAANE